MLIYVSGPFSADTEDQIAQNIHRAFAAGHALIDRGHWSKNLITVPMFGYNAGVGIAPLPPAHRPVKEAGMRELHLTPNDIERFWSKVAVGGPSECWPWLGGTDRDGYGRINIGGTIWFAHRVAWAIANGEVLGEHDGLHECDNPPCCNPAHLHPGTQRQNMGEMASRGRAQRGERHRFAKLTEADATAIRHSAAEGEAYASIAARYGIDQSAVAKIVARTRWGHVDDGFPKTRFEGNRGASNGSAKLCAEDVQAIRAGLGQGDSMDALASRFGVSTTAIRDIAKRRTWRHLADEEASAC